MILVCDGGSSKIDWAFIEGASVKQFQSAGTNPSLLKTSAEIVQIWQESLLEAPKELEAVYFYGAGCRDASSNQKMIDALNLRFDIKGNIKVDSDLVGAAISLYGTQSGNVLILGTGLNTGFFDGKKISYKSPSLGYLLGDEGSGFEISKTICAKYLRNELDHDLHTHFESYLISNKIDDLIRYIYSASAPNKTLASLLNAFSDYNMHPQLIEIVREQFKLMILHNCASYKSYSVNFRAVGSIAYHFQDILKACLAEQGYVLDVVEKSPINGLINFFRTGHDCLNS